MSWSRDSIGNILLIAVSVCLVCSVLVSGAAVALRPMQQANEESSRKQNVLVAAGLLEEGRRVNGQGQGVEEIFASFEQHVVDLRTGDYVNNIDPGSFDQLQAARNPELSRVLPPKADIATLKRLEHYGLVYLKRDEAGAVETLVIPIRGYGLWGTLYGFLALEGDFETVEGIGFYRHKETPGLGGEVDNPAWKASWRGKALYWNGEPAIELTKQLVPVGEPARQHQIDMLSGATMTSRGVENLVNFWVGELGYGPYLRSMREGSI